MAIAADFDLPYILQKCMGHWFLAFRLFGLCLLGLLGMTYDEAAAQGTVTWEQPINLSGTQTGSVHPAVLSDASGRVHVFWSEDLGGEPVGPGEELRTSASTIMYRSWDGVTWSDPVDILAVPGEDVAAFVSVALDPAGRLHATWTGQSNIYYSSAPGLGAGNPHAWTRPVAIAADNARSLRESAIAATPSGSVHVVYAARSPSPRISHISLRANGTILNAPTTISAPVTPLEGGYANVRLVSDQEGHLHATWQSFEKDGYGQAVYYSGSLDDGVSWSIPELLRYREAEDTFVEWAYLTAGPSQTLYLNYVDGTIVGRAFRVSQDGGTTWGESKKILRELEGINGYVTTLVDGKGQLHVLAPMRTREEQVVGIYHSTLAGNDFLPVVPVVTDEHSGGVSSAIHYLDAAVRLGNELHLVWNEIMGSEIWYVKGTIDGVLPAPTAQVPTPPAPTREADASASPSATPTAVSVHAITNADLRERAEQAATSAPRGSMWTPLLVAVIPVFVLLLGVVISEMRRR